MIVYVKIIYVELKVINQTASVMVMGMAIMICNKPQKRNRVGALLLGGGRLAARFRRMNILIFTVAFCSMAVMMLSLFRGIIETITAEYAGQYAISSAEALSTHISRDINIVSKVASSNAVIEWLMDEDNMGKKSLAHEEMKGIVSDLYSYNLYIGVEKTLNQYSVGLSSQNDDFILVDKFSENDPNDVWYFESINSGRDYLLNIGIDREMRRKRVWIDYKVTKDGVPIGVISTGLEFSHVVGELFSQYDRGNVRGLIINEEGVIYMDSALMGDKDFLFNEFETHIDEEFSNSQLLPAIKSHLFNSESYPEEIEKPVVIQLRSGPYSNVTIEPIRSTNWSIVILSGAVSLFSFNYFVPMIIIVLVMLSIAALSTSVANYRLIFMPLGKLDQSLTSLRENTVGSVYGAERNDELGNLSKTIQDLFVMANIDALTGIYNRRFMENNLDRNMDMLSRANGLLSVMMIDIDFFKKYNDAYGHDQGDVCLKNVACAISAGITRINDFSARYGGEEFVIVLPSTDENGVKIVAKKLLDSIRRQNIPHCGNTVAKCVTVSIGATTGRVSYGQNWKWYIKRADEALYISKKNGRDRITFLKM